jgi:lysozyme family protein
MAATNYQKSLAMVLIWEGGYSNHPADPGGATMRGVTQRVYDAFRRSHGVATRSVKMLTQSELEAIYRRQYWDLIKGDQLPEGVDYALFDLAVNSGVGRAVKILQKAVGVAQDGTLGVVTLDAIKGFKDRKVLIKDICALRLGFLKRLAIWATFGKGWGNRVRSVQQCALTMVV